MNAMYEKKLALQAESYMQLKIAYEELSQVSHAFIQCCVYRVDGARLCVDCTSARGGLLNAYITHYTRGYRKNSRNYRNFHSFRTSNTTADQYMRLYGPPYIRLRGYSVDRICGSTVFRLNVINGCAIDRMWGYP